MTIEYLISFIAAVGLLVAYMVMVKNKELWLTMLYVCVAVVNLGYTLLSMANTVNFAIFANDVVYLGSVFLSMCMFLTIVRLCGFKIKKAHIITCATLGIVMFSIVATSGLLPWYYKSVAIETVGSSSKLVKEYGPLHPVYMVYLLGYFGAMIATIILSVVQNKIGKPKFAVFIAGIVCGNIMVWLVEKFVTWDYEMLSVTYIVSEIALLFVYWMMQDYVHKNDVPPPVIVEEKQTVFVVDTMTKAEKLQKILDTLHPSKNLTARQTEMLEGILDGKSRKEIAIDLHISENTVKTHMTSLYETLGVSCKEEILALLQTK